MLGTEWFTEGRAWAVLLLRLIVSLAVTVHVLLRKRDVRSSAAWIGLVWIEPLFGGATYALLGVNRVRRRARRLRRGDRETTSSDPMPDSPGWDGHLAALEHAGRRISRRPVTADNAVTLLRDGDAAYPRMVAAIDAASRSVALSSYLLRDDEAGGRFIEALIAATRRGVQVRVLVDGIGSGYFRSAAYRRLRRNGVPAARFMHSLLPWRMPFLNLRTHKKMLVIDGTLGFTGGMNIGAENLVSTAPRHPVRDTHFEVAGPVVGQIAEAFAADWAFATGEQMDGPAWFPPIDASSGRAAARVITSGPDQDLEKIEFAMMEAIACARTRIVLVTPYFLPDTQFQNALALAAMRDVQVEIIIPERSNHRPVDWATRAHIPPLLHEGVQVWLNPAPFDHSKIMIVDDAWCMVGSANLDMRSLRLNFELNMEIYDSNVAAVLAAEVATKRGARLQLRDLRQRKLPFQLRDAVARLFLPYL